MGNEVSALSNQELIERQIAGVMAIDTEANDFQERLGQAGGNKWIIAVKKRFQTHDGRIGTVEAQRTDLAGHLRNFWRVRFNNGVEESMYPGSDMHEPQDEIDARKAKEKAELAAQQAYARKVAEEKHAAEKARRDAELERRQVTQKKLRDERLKEKAKHDAELEKEKAAKEAILAKKHEEELLKLERKHALENALKEKERQMKEAAEEKAAEYKKAEMERIRKLHEVTLLQKKEDQAKLEAARLAMERRQAQASLNGIQVEGSSEGHGDSEGHGESKGHGKKHDKEHGKEHKEESEIKGSEVPKYRE